MAKGTNMSKCPGTVFACSNYGSTVTSEKSISSDGFSIALSVVTLGYLLSREEIESYCRSLVSQLKRSLCNHEVDLEFGNDQYELPF